MRSLGTKLHFWPSQRLKKVLLTTQGCARLRTGPIIIKIPRGYQKKKFIVWKGAICATLREKTPFVQKHKEGAICAILREKTPFLAFIVFIVWKGAICATLREKNQLCKSTKKARYVRSLGKKPHFWPSQRLKKVLLTTQGCARLRTGPIIMQIPRGYQKKSLWCGKARYVRPLGKKPHFWPSQRLKKVLLLRKAAQGCALAQ